MKRGISVLLLIALLLSLTACGGETRQQETRPVAAPEEEQAPEAETNIPGQSVQTELAAEQWILKTKEYEPFAARTTLRGMARIDDAILFSLSEGGPLNDGRRHYLALSTYRMEEDGVLKLSPPRELELDEPEAPEEAFLYDVAAGGDGCFYILSGELPETYMLDGELQHNEKRNNSYRVMRCSQSGEMLAVLHFPFFELNNLRGLAALDADHILLYGDEGLALVDSTGQVQRREALEPEGFAVAAQRCGEQLVLSVFLSSGEGRYVLCDLVSGETKALPLSEDLEISWKRCQGLAEEFLLEEGGTFSELSPESGMKQEIMRWNFRNEGCAGAIRLGERAFLCRNDRSGVLTYAHMVHQEPIDRETVKVAVYCVDDYMGLASLAKTALRGFENDDPRYAFEVTEYGEDELDRLLVQLTSADAPDLMIFNQGINTASHAFLDLYALLDVDPELSRESFLPRLLEDLSVNGELHELWTEVNVITMAARVSDVGDGLGMTTADYDRILAESDRYDAVFQHFMDKVNLLRYVATVGISRYVDRAEGTCCFDDPSFRELLAWCARMCDEIPEGSDSTFALYPEDVVLWFEWMQTPKRLSALENNIFHEPFVFVGFPTGDDMGSYYTMEEMAMAIPAAAKNPEGAWAFLRSRLLPEEQYRQYFPVNLEAALRQLREDGNEQDEALLLDLLDHTGFAENIADEPLRQIVMDCGMAYLRGEKDLDETIRLLQSRASIYMSERYG